MEIEHVKFLAEKRAEFLTSCTLEVSIGVPGTVDLSLWVRDAPAPFARISIYNVAKMKELAALLNTMADAKLAQNDKRLDKKVS